MLIKMCSFGTENIELEPAVCKILAIGNGITVAALKFKLSTIPSLKV